MDKKDKEVTNQFLGKGKLKEVGIDKAMAKDKLKTTDKKHEANKPNDGAISDKTAGKEETKEKGDGKLRKSTLKGGKHEKTSEAEKDSPSKTPPSVAQKTASRTEEKSDKRDRGDKASKRDKSDKQDQDSTPRNAPVDRNDEEEQNRILRTGRTNKLAGFWATRTDEVKIERKKIEIDRDSEPIVLENEPEVLEGVARALDENDRSVSVSSGHAKNMASMFQNIKDEPKERKRFQFDVDFSLDAAIYENEPEELTSGVVRSADKGAEEVEFERGKIKNMVGHFRQQEEDAARTKTSGSLCKGRPSWILEIEAASVAEPVSEAPPMVEESPPPPAAPTTDKRANTTTEKSKRSSKVAEVNSDKGKRTSAKDEVLVKPPEVVEDSADGMKKKGQKFSELVLLPPRADTSPHGHRKYYKNK